MAGVSALMLGVALLPALTMSASAVVAPVGQGFAVTPSDLSYILKQIKIAEAHVESTTSETGPCGALLGAGPNQLGSPLLSLGLRTVDGSCNNLTEGQAQNGASGQLFPRLVPGRFQDADTGSLGGPPAPSSYKQKSGSVFDSQPRVISNLIVDQTSTNPAAVAAAARPFRSQGGAAGVVPCTTDPDPVTGEGAVPADCTPSGQTLLIPNVTTDVGLSPPYNSLFTLFGQFFDHGIDQTVKGGGSVFVPLKADDPLIPGPDGALGTADDLSPNLRFMVITRGKNQPGPDGVLGSADDVQDAKNTNSPWVDQSQTYTSNASHQMFVREYADNASGRPVSTGDLLGGPAGPTAGGMSTWATVKQQARDLLGLALQDADATDVPMMATDPYGKFLPGPARGLPQYVTGSGLVEGDRANPVPVPADVLRIDIPFLTDIAHNADPSPVDSDRNPRTPPVAPAPDANSTASADFANQPPGTYDDELLDAHFTAGDGRVNENIGLTAVHQVFHSEHSRLVDDIKDVLSADTSAAGAAALAEWKSGAGADGWNGERLFQAARFINEMEYQHLVFEEFARKVQPGINPFQPFTFAQTNLNPAVTAEFAAAVYRFGHSMLTDTISRRNEELPGPDSTLGTADDVPGSTNDISLLEGFLNPPEYTDGGAAGPLTSEQAAGSVITGMSDQVGNELDEFVTETLRNNLLGLPLDLAAVNMARARSEGISPLNVLRRELFAATNDGQLTPYRSWVDFGENIKNRPSLVNFVAAYGKHPTVLTDAGPDGVVGDDAATTADESADDGPATLASRRTAAQRIVDPVLGELRVPADAADFMNSTGSWANDGTTSITGLDDVDLWVGGLAEVTTPFGGLLGTTFNYVFERQLTDLQNGDRLYYLARTPGMNLRASLEGNSFAELIMRNTNVQSLKADAFATSDCKFELKKLAGTAAGFAASGNTVADDASSDCDESALLIRQPDGTIQYRAVNSVDAPGINGQSVYNGTSGVDRARGGNDNDTFWGGLGNDVFEGGGGADVALGGEGNDIITDLGGDDVPKGGPGNDAIDAGPGLDILHAGAGSDFTNGGANGNQTFGGPGDDIMSLGDGIDQGLGDGGDDYQEGGNGPDLMIGDSSNLFFLDESQRPGHDILVGQGGDDDYDLEGGDDIGVAGPGVEKIAGASGFDWEISQGDPQAGDMDLNLPLNAVPILNVGVRDRYNEVEALSGWKLDDTLRGANAAPATIGGAGFIGCDALDQAGVDRISGLDPLLPALNTPRTTVVQLSASGDCPLLTGDNVWGDGDILLGGAGSDLLEGRGADDIIDGDRYLGIRLSVRNSAGVEVGTTGVEATGQSAMTSRYLKDGAGNPTGPTLQQAVFAGTVDPGRIVAVREILTGSGGTDTAVFSGPRSSYSVTTSPASATELAKVTVTQLVAPVAPQTISDGTDTLRNVEQLRFTNANGTSTTVLTKVPNAPTVVTATVPPSTTGTASLTWQAPAVTTNESPRTSYEIVATPTTGPAVTRIGVAANATSSSVTGLVNGMTYTIQVRAVNMFGPGPLSAASNPVVPAGPPGAPTGLAGVRGNGQVALSWAAPASDGGSPITGYTVQVRQGTTVLRTETLTGQSTSTVITGLTNGTAYTFRVATVNARGTSATTNTAAITPATVPDAPILGAVTSGTAGGARTVAVAWTPPAFNGGATITSYTVVAHDPNGVEVQRVVTTGGTRTRTFTFAAVGPYTFRVQANNQVTTGTPVASLGAGPFTDPSAPTNAL